MNDRQLLTNLQQELILILMQPEIPIIVTKKGKNGMDIVFKMMAPHIIHQIKQTRSPTAPKPRNTNPQPRHQTLDPNNQPPVSRSRRISSSAASKRFPKDFFRDQNCLHPIKSNKNKHKQYQPSLLDTFSHKNFLVPDKQPSEQNPANNENDTPKFTQKGQRKVIKTNNLNELLKNKMKQVVYDTSIFSQYNTATENHKPLVQLNQEQTLQKSQPFGQIPLISNFNITLGQKISLTYLMQKSQRQIKKSEMRQKENNNVILSSSDQAKRQKSEGFRIRKKMLG